MILLFSSAQRYIGLLYFLFICCKSLLVVLAVPEAPGRTSLNSAPSVD